MNSFRYQAIESSGSSVEGLIEAEDRKAALRLLGQRGLFPASLEISFSNREAAAPAVGQVAARTAAAGYAKQIRRKDITTFTREMSALLAAAIPIPQALDGLGEQEENPTDPASAAQAMEAIRAQLREQTTPARSTVYRDSRD